MKRTFVFAAAMMVLGTAYTQQPEDLTVTLPTGKIITCTSAEQKTKILLALNPQPAATVLGAPAITQPESARKPFAPSLGDAPSSGSQTGSIHPTSSGTGVGNVGAPMFTANYYLPAAATWVGKKLTLSVANMESSTVPRADGLVQLSAYTYNQGNSGGSINVVAPPDVAMKLVTLCGGTFQYNYSGLRTTVIHGVMQQEKGENGAFYVLVEKQ